MSKSDAEMDDEKQHASDSGDIIRERENKVQDFKVEKVEETLGPEISVSGDASRNENGGKDINKSRDEDEDSIKANSVEKDQTTVRTENNEPVDGSTCEEINAKSGKEGPMETKSDDQATSGEVAEKQIDAENEVVEQNATDNGVKEQKSSDIGVDGGNNIENVDEKTSEDVEEKKSEGVSKLDVNNVDDALRGENNVINTDAGNDQVENSQFPIELSAHEASQNMNADVSEVQQDEVMEDTVNLSKDDTVKDNSKEQDGEPVLNHCSADGNEISIETASKHVPEDSSTANQDEAATPTSETKSSPAKAKNHSGEIVKAPSTPAALPLMGESDDGTPEEQATFMKELESFYRERSMDFKPPKFYGKPLNCLKLWRAVIKLGGYERVSGCKLWRQVGESFHPPKTCTTVSWTFRIFYEKSLLEYERHKAQIGELPLPVASCPEASGADVEGNGYQGSGSGRARRDSATRAMQGWHAQRLFGSGEVGEPIVKDKNHNNTPKREKNLKSIGSLKQKRPDEVEHSNKVARAEISKQLVTPVVDVGPAADWVKINVQQTRDCFEIYALVPGLLREEVRVQTDPAGRVVISGQPEQVENPWGITPFRKVVSLPSRIDPIQTSAVFSLHGRLLIRVPFEHPDIALQT